MRYLNRWSLSCAWVAMMMVTWFALVPGELSLSTWVLTTIGGPVLLVGAAMFWESSRPTPSFRQSQAVVDVLKGSAARRRP